MCSSKTIGPSCDSSSGASAPGLAEDRLQDAFTRNLDRLSDMPHEALVPWFTGCSGMPRSTATVARAPRSARWSRLRRSWPAAAQPDDAFHREICACVGRRANTLKPEYAEALRAVDVEDTPVKAFAETAGLTTRAPLSPQRSNASCVYSSLNFLSF